MFKVSFVLMYKDDIGIWRLRLSLILRDEKNPMGKIGRNGIFFT
jgi:hypothetical protein